jgi:hypothetical protein
MTSYPRRTETSATTLINGLFEPSKNGREFIGTDIAQHYTLRKELNCVSEIIILFKECKKYTIFC